MKLYVTTTTTEEFEIVAHEIGDCLLRQFFKAPAKRRKSLREIKVLIDGDVGVWKTTMACHIASRFMNGAAIIRPDDYSYKFQFEQKSSGKQKMQAIFLDMLGLGYKLSAITTVREYPGPTLIEHLDHTECRAKLPAHIRKKLPAKGDVKIRLSFLENVAKNPKGRKIECEFFGPDFPTDALLERLRSSHISAQLIA